jgi:glycosyltransferase involved in cell wall biosynthesis
MTAPLRILHVITAFDRGGAENHLADLVRHQRRSGVEVTIAYLRGTGAWAAGMREIGATVEDLALRFYGDLRPLVRLRRLIARGSFHLVHAHLPPAELYARLALLGTPASLLPLVISKHNDCAFHRLPGELLLERWVARRASAMIVISDAVNRYMTNRRVGLPPCRMETIRYGIDVAPFENVTPGAAANLRAEWGANPDTLVIGFVGRIVEQKNIETLIRAFALMQRDRPCDAKLVIVGDGPLVPALRRCASESGVGDRIAWAGFRADIPVVMRAFDVFALTSIFEGFGLVLIEAMAARRPVVATRVSAIPEVVAEGETGFLAEPRSAESVAAALAKLADRDLRAKFGAAGFRRASEHFTLDRMWKSTDAIYAACLKSAPTRAAESESLKPSHAA